MEAELLVGSSSNERCKKARGEERSGDGNLIRHKAAIFVSSHLYF